MMLVESIPQSYVENREYDADQGIDYKDGFALL
jgi:hypothetical protein